MKNQWSAAPPWRGGAEKALRWAKILSIEPVAEEDVYDVEIEDTHNFVANGIIAHNTYLGNLLASASSTIGDGTQTGGLTISGGATTTATSTLAGLLVTSGNVGDWYGEPCRQTFIWYRIGRFNPFVSKWRGNQLWLGNKRGANCSHIFRQDLTSPSI